MLCDYCKVNLATVKVTKFKDYTSFDLYLCEKCSKKEQQIGSSAKASNNLMKGVIKSEVHKTCPMCHMTFSELKKTGKAGCGQCYKTFNKELMGIIKNIYGEANHRGKMPRLIKEQQDKASRINHYKKALREAVEQEEYELAARLRDAIKDLEKDEVTNEQ